MPCTQLPESIQYGLRHNVLDQDFKVAGIFQPPLLKLLGLNCPNIERPTKLKKLKKCLSMPLPLFIAIVLSWPILES